MISSFDYYKRVESPVMYLCNPDKKFICALQSENRHLILRFNDLSELTFSVPKALCGDSAYALIESKRLIFIEKIGWFQIENVTETVEGNACTKAVTAQSHQYCLKNRGFVTEERLYMFYNPYDPLDERYDSSNLAAIPSVIGQLYQQTGIKVELSPYSIDVTEDKIDWTITYIDPLLKFKAKSYGSMYEPADGAENVCRSFKADEKLNGYDFIINQVEQAFEVIFEFDFLYHTIQVKTLDDVTKPTDIYLSFDNLVNTLEVQENAEDIVTVLSCNGGDIDIRTVNPMGTNYIVDFSYYKKAKSDDGKVDYPWMSAELIAALDEWKAEFDKNKDGYSALVEKLQNEYVSQGKNSGEIQAANLKLTDLLAARDQYTNKEDGAEDGSGIVSPETVASGEKSLKSGTKFYTTPFSADATLTGHTGKPNAKKDETTGVYTFSFSDSGKTGTANSLLQDYLAPEEGDDESEESGYIYFMDEDLRSYCKLNVGVDIEVAKDADGNPVIFSPKTSDAVAARTGTVDIDGIRFTVTKEIAEEYVISCDGFSLKFASNTYFVYGGNRYMVSASADGIVTVTRYYAAGFDRFTTYKETAGVGGWCDIWEAYIKNTLVPEKNDIDGRIKDIESQMKAISDVCNVQKFIKSKGGSLYDELSNYWIEGEYTNDNIAASDSITISERIEFAKELMEAGETDLEKNAQPKFEMSVNAVNFIKIYEFRQFTRELELGRVITIEKADGVHYYPALMSIEYDIDSADSFTLTFSNASRPGDTAMTFADLIKEASSTSRTVSANWSNLMDYTHNKDQITRLIEYPLDRSLRAMQENLSNQEFIIDDSGILGRKYDTEFDGAKGTFSPEQVRMINNTIIFTKDNWETAALALGKTVYGYGLVAEVLVGNIILGKQISIGSESERVTISNDGIVIKDNNGHPIFNASKDGNLSLKGNITATGLTISKEVANGAGLAGSDDVKDLENNLGSQIDDVSKGVGDLETAVGDIGDNVSVLTQNFDVINGNLTSTIKRVDTIEGSYATKTSVSTLKQTVDTISLDVKTIEVDYAKKSELKSGEEGITAVVERINNDYATGTDLAATNENIKDNYAPKESGATESFSYSLKSDGFTLNANGDTVFKCTKDGVEVTGSGAFTGTINADKGTIGGFTIGEDSISSGETGAGLTFDASGVIIANSMEIEKSFNAKVVNCTKMQGQASGSASLSFEESYGEIETVTVNVKYTITEQGSQSAGSYNEGKVTVTVEASKALKNARTFTVTAIYSSGSKYEPTTDPGITKTYYPTIKAGAKSGSTTIPHVLHEETQDRPGLFYTYAKLRTISVSPTSFTQLTGVTKKAISSDGGIMPTTSGLYLGDASHRWRVFSTADSDSSDRKLKTNIENLSEELALKLIGGLVPRTYKFKDFKTPRTRAGFIAQEVEELLLSIGLTTEDLALVSKSKPDEADGADNVYSMEYKGLIAPVVKVVQVLMKKVCDLEEMIAIQKGRQNEIKQIIASEKGSQRSRQ